VNRRPRAADLSSAARHEIVSLQPRLSLALALAGMLPPYTANALRVRLLRAGGVKIGERTGIAGRLWIAGGARPASRLVIGNGCLVNDGCRFDVSAPVTIRDGAFVGHDVAVITSSHELGDATRRAGRDIAQPVVIGAGSWVGARATILGGVTIGDGAVVAAGAVVTRSVAQNTLVGGVPAAWIRDLD
jgi:acetyltransferase-like isoleucine patch superfamily enzyme